MYSFRQINLRTLAATIAIYMPTWIQAQQTTLYDPQPPANSAYVRVIVGGVTPPVDVWVNKKPKLTLLTAGTPSDYMVLPAGQHDLSIQSGKHQIPVKLEVKASRSLTVLVPSFGQGRDAIVIEDKVNSNRLKAIITVYQLGSTEPLDLWTADGGTQIFKALPMGGTAALVVNPINLEFQVTAAGSKSPLATGKLSMTPGGAYSLVITGGKTGALAVQSHVNTVERYKAP